MYYICTYIYTYIHVYIHTYMYLCRDMRVPHSSSPLQCMTTDKAIVMINFSPNDSMLLSAGSDNEVHQYMVANGQKHLTYDIPKRHSSVNFTRAYYSGSGAYVATGGSEEDCVSLLSAASGALLCNVPVSPGPSFPSPYVQSLRPCPLNDNRLTVLMNDRVLGHRQLVHIELTADSFGRAAEHWGSSSSASSSNSASSSSSSSSRTAASPGPAVLCPKDALMLLRYAHLSIVVIVVIAVNVVVIVIIVIVDIIVDIVVDIVIFIDVFVCLFLFLLLLCRDPAYVLALKGAAAAASTSSTTSSSSSSSSTTAVCEDSGTVPLLPPAERYIEMLDRLWFQSIGGSSDSGGSTSSSSSSSSKLKCGVDGVVYLTYRGRGRGPMSVSAPAPAHRCLCRGAAPWSSGLSVCVPVYAVVVCARNAVLKRLITEALSAEAEAAVGAGAGGGGGDVCCSGGAASGCPCRVLSVSLDAALCLCSGLEALVLSNVVMRYLYSSSLSIDALLALASDAAGIADRGLLDASFDESLQQWAAPSKQRTHRHRPHGGAGGRGEEGHSGYGAPSTCSVDDRLIDALSAVS
jgi:hypothetical protein